ncbi:uncharacterized protein LY89DRAFT_288604 [Mollisia scopiformis]|uniref:Uncharacterized protein n=1 Tax=Mollisia scopiformis TaxID=149040 RepID=A0A132BAM9_MOLSC|nr:uncharacterized protein LY89DRAFT_288604 [Mollisia scopiformis]KUJ09470.1 hypothetical protein LY89DRAFT_288604 [Mollisia scopiformis]
MPIAIFHFILQRVHAAPPGGSQTPLYWLCGLILQLYIHKSSAVQLATYRHVAQTHLHQKSAIRMPQDRSAR